MPRYVLLMRYQPGGLRAIHADPTVLHRMHEAIARWETKVLESYRLLGEWDQCIVVDAPDNFKAYRGSLAQELSATADCEILPCIDQELFARMISSEAGTEGPHRWQISFWAKAARRVLRHREYDRLADDYFKPFTVTGRHKFDSFESPCIVVANHTSHMDNIALNVALPPRVRYNVYAGAAADRWFVKGRKELIMQPWYQSLVMGTFPIQRGGGSKALDYPRWLLDRGCNLIIFPEGTRSTSRTMAKFRHGVSILALEKQVPVVPVFLTGLAKIRPKGSRELFPGPVGAHVLDPIHFPAGTEVPEATRILYEAMNRVHLAVQAHGDDAARQD